MTQTPTKFEQATQLPVIHEYQKYVRAGSRYINPYSGESISRNRYSQLRKEAGVVGRQRTYFQTPDQIDEQLVGEYQQQLAGQGITLSPRQIARSSNFQVILANLSDETGRYDVLGVGGRYKTLYPADSPKAWALVQIGRREPDWSFAVGDTPKNE